MSRIYAAGAAMGWTVAQVKTTSMWEFWSAWHGYVKANTPSGSEKMDAQMKDELLDWLEADTLATGQSETQTYLWDGWFVEQGYVVIPAPQ